MYKPFPLAIAAIFVIAASTPASETPQPSESPAAIVVQSEIEVTASLGKSVKVGGNSLVLKVTDRSGAPVKDAKITLSVGMTNMDMGTAHPAVTNNGDGTYSASPNFTMAGPWRVTAEVEAPGRGSVKKSFDFHAEGSGESMDMGSMMGRLGNWSMQKEGSGTSWLPESSPMFMKALPKSDKYDLSAMGYLTFNENDAGGPRGDSRFFSNSMLMLMGHRKMGEGLFGFSIMASLDPVFNGQFGYPDLFQTGETAYGQSLVDYQHPHDLLAEVAATYSHPLGKGLRGFIYAAPVGEPALGGPVFMHRPSGMEIPEAPISHHWFDSTHIAWGVLTLGANTDNWQYEVSAFNGHEPDENRYSPDPIRLNSASTRLTFNPNKNLSLSGSYGFLHSPESSEPGVHQHRLTAVAIWSQPMARGANLSMTAAFGRNYHDGHASDAFLTEATYLTGPTSIFARWEHVMKDELIGVPEGNYMINKFTLGGVRNFYQRDGFDVGIGAYASFHVFPSSLEPFYGKSPVSLGVFLRIRPGRMQHEMSGG